jgi:hypothetical protein
MKGDSPNKRNNSNNNDLTNKFNNLKAKLANYTYSTNSNTNLKTNTNNNISYQRKSSSMSDKEAFDRMIAGVGVVEDNSQLTFGSSSNTVLNNDNKPYISTLNELKKKWNDVSNKNKNQDKSHSPSMRTNNRDSVNSNLDRLNEIKNKYNMVKMKNPSNNNNDK